MTTLFLFVKYYLDYNLGVFGFFKNTIYNNIICHSYTILTLLFSYFRELCYLVNWKFGKVNEWQCFVILCLRYIAVDYITKLHSVESNVSIFGNNHAFPPFVRLLQDDRRFFYFIALVIAFVKSVSFSVLIRKSKSQYLTYVWRVWWNI